MLTAALGALLVVVLGATIFILLTRPSAPVGPTAEPDRQRPGGRYPDLHAEPAPDAQPQRKPLAEPDGFGVARSDRVAERRARARVPAPARQPPPSASASASPSPSPTATVEPTATPTTAAVDRPHRAEQQLVTASTLASTAASLDGRASSASDHVRGRRTEPDQRRSITDSERRRHPAVPLREQRRTEPADDCSTSRNGTLTMSCGEHRCRYVELERDDHRHRDERQPIRDADAHVQRERGCGRCCRTSGYAGTNQPEYNGFDCPSHQRRCGRRSPSMPSFESANSPTSSWLGALGGGRSRRPADRPRSIEDQHRFPAADRSASRSEARKPGRQRELGLHPRRAQLAVALSVAGELGDLAGARQRGRHVHADDRLASRISPRSAIATISSNGSATWIRRSSGSGPSQLGSACDVGRQVQVHQLGREPGRGPERRPACATWRRDEPVSSISSRLAGDERVLHRAVRLAVESPCRQLEQHLAGGVAVLPYQQHAPIG